MFQCHVCGGSLARREVVSEVFTVDGRRVLVEHIPVEVCQRCGEPAFSRETTEEVRQLIHGDRPPERTVPLDVFSLA